MKENSKAFSGKGSDFPSEEKALEKALAIQEIKNIVADYCNGFDKKDIDLLMSVWADDAHVVWTDATWDLRGKEEIRKAYSESIAAWSNSRHSVYNWHIQVDGNKATSTHSWAWHADDAENTTWAGEGGYYREFVKEKGVWKIKYQKMTQDWFRPASGHMPL